VVPLLKVDWLEKPFEGVIAMRDTCFEPEAETADAPCAGDGVGASAFPLLARNYGRDFRRDGGRGERGDSAEQPAGGEASGRFGGSTSKRSS
jgi:hypothetical protein